MLFCLCVIAIVALVTAAYSMGHRDGAREEHERQRNALAHDSKLPDNDALYEATFYIGSGKHTTKRKG